MRLGDLYCPWHPGMTLDQCQDLHKAVTDRQCETPGCDRSGAEMDGCNCTYPEGHPSR